MKEGGCRKKMTVGDKVEETIRRRQKHKDRNKVKR